MSKPSFTSATSAGSSSGGYIPASPLPPLIPLSVAAGARDLDNGSPPSSPEHYRSSSDSSHSWGEQAHDPRFDLASAPASQQQQQQQQQLEASFAASASAFLPAMSSRSISGSLGADTSSQAAETSTSQAAAAPPPLAPGDAGPLNKLPPAHLEDLIVAHSAEDPLLVEALEFHRSPSSFAPVHVEDIISQLLRRVMKDPVPTNVAPSFPASPLQGFRLLCEDEIVNLLAHPVPPEDKLHPYKDFFRQIGSTVAPPQPPGYQPSPHEAALRLIGINTIIDSLQRGGDLRFIGECIGHRHPFFIHLMNCFLQRFDFFGLGIVEALSSPEIRAPQNMLPRARACMHFLASFVLPSESQQIDRVVAAFAYRHWQTSPLCFADPDAAHILAFAIVLLHTDLHKASSQAAGSGGAGSGGQSSGSSGPPMPRMRRSEFRRNCRDVGGGARGGVGRRVLNEIYENIRLTPLRFPGSATAPGAAAAAPAAAATATAAAAAAAATTPGPGSSQPPPPAHAPAQQPHSQHDPSVLRHSSASSAAPSMPTSSSSSMVSISTMANSSPSSSPPLSGSSSCTLPLTAGMAPPVGTLAADPAIPTAGTPVQSGGPSTVPPSMAALTKSRPSSFTGRLFGGGQRTRSQTFSSDATIATAVTTPATPSAGEPPSPLDAPVSDLPAALADLQSADTPAALAAATASGGTIRRRRSLVRTIRDLTSSSSSSSSVASSSATDPADVLTTSVDLTATCDSTPSPVVSPTTDEEPTSLVMSSRPVRPRPLSMSIPPSPHVLLSEPGNCPAVTALPPSTDAYLKNVPAPSSVYQNFDDPILSQPVHVKHELDEDGQKRRRGAGGGRSWTRMVPRLVDGYLVLLDPKFVAASVGQLPAPASAGPDHIRYTVPVALEPDSERELAEQLAIMTIGLAESATSLHQLITSSYVDPAPSVSKPPHPADRARSHESLLSGGSAGAGAGVGSGSAPAAGEGKSSPAPSIGASSAGPASPNLARRLSDSATTGAAAGGAPAAVGGTIPPATGGLGGPTSRGLSTSANNLGPAGNTVQQRSSFLTSQAISSSHLSLSEADGAASTGSALPQLTGQILLEAGVPLEPPVMPAGSVNTLLSPLPIIQAFSLGEAICLVGSEASVVRSHAKRAHVVRLRAARGVEILLDVGDEAACQLWVRALNRVALHVTSLACLLGHVSTGTYASVCPSSAGASAFLLNSFSHALLSGYLSQKSMGSLSRSKPNQKLAASVKRYSRSSVLLQSHLATAPTIQMRLSAIFRRIIALAPTHSQAVVTYRLSLLSESAVLAPGGDAGMSTADGLAADEADGDAEHRRLRTYLRVGPESAGGGIHGVITHAAIEYGLHVAAGAGALVLSK
ncbi:hypothetical protein H696_02449 [Fonticula alba]|uniref:SEC7 domain-containing protein n=1 Tax=Fonticula alba TaxID=691883 RepID=A0A058ZAR1_FONAL|nr:hypothetical protein H696_02449 [Fonticula alba]KCV71505.1 hypothetical protein H696_02449 [Fonticula alba]|eukprot:XP_009494628.1 hypothetical protein H696_02449 [Fonticula alba]